MLPHSDKRFQRKNYIFRKGPLEALQVGAKRSKGNGQKFGVLTFATRDFSGETLLFLTAVGANYVQEAFQMPNTRLRKCETNLFSSVKFAKSLSSSVSHTYPNTLGY